MAENALSPSAFNTSTPSVISTGLVSAAPLAKLLEEERRNAEISQAAPVISNLASYVRKCWNRARDAKRNTVEQRMLQSIRARRGEYDPVKLSAIRETGGSEVYAMLTSVKCRAASSWLRDVLLANGTEKPWTLSYTPIPDTHPMIEQFLTQRIEQEVQEMEAQGTVVSEVQAARMAGDIKERAMEAVRTQARKAAMRIETKMEDQLIEGGFSHALNQFIDDVVTYPAAILKGPIVRNKKQLKWVEDPESESGYSAGIETAMKLEWERVSPFDIYPSPEAESVNDGYLIEKHRLSRQDLNDLLGVEGYDDGAIRLVLERYGGDGLRDWLYDDIGEAAAVGKSSTELMTNPDNLIDALQFWGSVQGRLLLDWGLTKDEIPDPMREYHAEIWTIGPYVIKATLNYHPMACKPYYKTSYEEIPGSFWGNSPCDLVRDAQDVVNAATRSLVNNMALSSGPQVVVNVDRLAPGEEVTTLKPWRIWQVNNEQIAMSGGAQTPIDFNQPKSNVQELAGIIKMFMDFADEWSGIPKYLTGDAPGGAGRTASGLSMLMNNAGKSLKQVVSNVDNYVMRPLLEGLHYWNMMYSQDPETKGDIMVVVRGANALVAKEAAQLRRNEFLAQTANPIDMQIIGLDGRAHILREAAKSLDMDTDKIVPNDLVLKHRQAMAQQAQAQEAARQQGQQGQQGQPGAPLAPLGVPEPNSSGQALADGTPITDDFTQPSQ